MLSATQPIALADGRDLILFASVRVLLMWLEVEDVRQGRYIVFDADGKQLQLAIGRSENSSLPEIRVSVDQGQDCVNVAHAKMMEILEAQLRAKGIKRVPEDFPGRIAALTRVMDVKK